MKAKLCFVIAVSAIMLFVSTRGDTTPSGPQDEAVALDESLDAGSSRSEQPPAENVTEADVSDSEGQVRCPHPHHSECGPDTTSGSGCCQNPHHSQCVVNTGTR